MLLPVALVLAGCVTVSNTLPADQVTNLRLTEVRVSYAPGARIWWGDGERAYAATKGVAATEAEAIANTPDGQAYIRNAISSRIKTAMERQLAAQLAGSRPVRVEVGVKDVSIASVIQRVIVGGAHTMTADVTLVDAKTGAVLVSYPAQRATAAAGGGIAGAVIDSALLAEPIDRVVDNYATQYGNWLLRR